MTSVLDYSTTDLSNSTIHSINIAEDCAPENLNNMGRAIMADIAKWLHAVTGEKTTGGTADAQTLTTGFGWSVEAAMTIAFKAGTLLTNTGAMTLNVDGLGARSVKFYDNTELAAGTITAGGVYMVAFETATSTWRLIGVSSVTRASLGLATSDSPEFTAINLGHASDTTLARSGAGDVTIEGNAVYRAGGTDVPVTDGGSGASTAAGAATAFGVGTGDSPQFTAVNVGHATDTTIARALAGVITVDGQTVPTLNNANTWAGDQTVPDEAYDATAWNGSLEVPTKNAVRDKFESLSSGYPPGHLFGLILSNDGGDTTNDINVTAGSARDADDTVNLVLAAEITKRIDATWTVGDNAGGMNTGSVANSTWYEVHLIRRSDTGVVDVMFTTTANRATLPTSYDSQRQIGWVRRGVATNLQFTQIGDHFTLTTQVQDVGTGPTATATQVTLTVPPNTIARFRGSLYFAAFETASIKTVLSEIVEGNVAPQGTTGIVSLNVSNVGDTAGFYVQTAGHFELRVDASSQIEHDSDLGGSTEDQRLAISTFGWIDHRGRLQ